MRYSIAYILCVLLLPSCKISCENLPVHIEREILVLPVRVDPTPNPHECEAEKAYIETLQYRLNFENCTSTGYWGEYGSTRAYSNPRISISNGFETNFEDVSDPGSTLNNE